MKTGSSILSAMLGVVVTLASSQALAQTAPNPNPPPTVQFPNGRLLFRPQPLMVFSVQGASVYFGNGLRLYVINGPIGTGVDNPNVDEQGLRNWALACAQGGQSCGTAVSAQTANSIYDWLERTPMEALRLDNLLAATNVLNGVTYTVTGTQGRTVTAIEDQVWLRARICTPLLAAFGHPQCPPGGWPGPRIELFPDLQAGYLFGPPYAPYPRPGL